MMDPSAHLYPTAKRFENAVKSIVPMMTEVMDSGKELLELMSTLVIKSTERVTDLTTQTVEDSPENCSGPSQPSKTPGEHSKGSEEVILDKWGLQPDKLTTSVETPLKGISHSRSRVANIST